MGKRRNTKYSPMQVRPSHYKEFKRMCDEDNLHVVDGFGEALFAWKAQRARRDD